MKLNFDICQCCSDIPAVSLNIVSGWLMQIIFPSIREYHLPAVFSTNWQPQIMPLCNFALSNTFANFNINSMGANNYPPRAGLHEQTDITDRSMY